MKKYLAIPFFTGLLFLINIVETQAQEKINKIYADVAIGGTVIGGIGLNAHAGVGYQFHELLGVGIGGTAATENSDYSPDNFTGIGLEYRLTHKRFILKNTLGIFTNADYDSDDGQIRYEQIDGRQDWFYRGAIGYSPKNSYFNFGFVFNYTRGKYNQYDCGFEQQDGCQLKPVSTNSIVSPQVYVGLNFPKK